MCRFFGYVGEPIALATHLLDAPHSLEVQAYRPREMVSGNVNVDGTGIAWWAEGDPTPWRYVFAGPPWADPNIAALTARWKAPSALAVVRSATPGLGHGPDHLQPFVDPDLALTFAHNGWVGGFRGEVGRQLLARLDAARLAGLAALNDSAVLAQLAFEQVAHGHPPYDALRQLARDVLELAEFHGQAASLNLALGSARQVVAMRAARGVDSNSLYTSERPSGALVASEPLDAGDWAPVPPDSIVTIEADRVHVDVL